ncbi:hypothetical protein D3C86_1302420 [compost metagenome]
MILSLVEPLGSFLGHLQQLESLGVTQPPFAHPTDTVGGDRLLQVVLDAPPFQFGPFLWSYAKLALEFVVPVGVRGSSLEDAQLVDESQRLASSLLGQLALRRHALYVLHVERFDPVPIGHQLQQQDIGKIVPCQVLLTDLPDPHLVKLQVAAGQLDRPGLGIETHLEILPLFGHGPHRGAPVRLFVCCLESVFLAQPQYERVSVAVTADHLHGIGRGDHPPEQAIVEIHAWCPALLRFDGDAGADGRRVDHPVVFVDLAAGGVVERCHILVV